MVIAWLLGLRADRLAPLLGHLLLQEELRRGKVRIKGNTCDDDMTPILSTARPTTGRAERPTKRGDPAARTGEKEINSLRIENEIHLFRSSESTEDLWSEDMYLPEPYAPVPDYKG